MVSFDGQDLAAESTLSPGNRDSKSGAAGLRWAAGVKRDEIGLNRDRALGL
jgi:hypothetical protein